MDERDDDPATLGCSVGVLDGFRKNDDTKYIISALIINDFVIAKNDSSFVGCGCCTLASSSGVACKIQNTLGTQ